MSPAAQPANPIAITLFLAFIALNPARHLARRSAHCVERLVLGVT